LVIIAGFGTVIKLISVSFEATQLPEQALTSTLYFPLVVVFKVAVVLPVSCPFLYQRYR